MVIRRAIGLIAAAALGAAAQFPLPAPADMSGAGKNIRRTMSLLATSTPRQRNAVKILFYGQSITKQNWWKDVAGELRKQYPYADLTTANLALGGFASPMLRRPMVHDILPFYPDLIIFHDYGGEPEYEEIIRWIRSNTTAEIALQTDHVTWLPDPSGKNDEKAMKTYNFHERHCSEWMPALAKKYGLEVIDIRTPWKRYLAENKLQPKDLLSDSVHLNAHGDFLMANLTLRHLRYDAPPDTSRGLVFDFKPEWKDGKFTLEFEGNRVDLLASRSGRQPWSRARILIDGKKPSEFPELYALTRPSDSVAVDWPFVIRVDSQAPLLVEDWFLTILETDPGNKVVKFAVHGSKTGPDGNGVSTERFVSKSGRIVIDPSDWHLQRATAYSKVLTPAGAVCRWKVIPLFRDTYEPPLIDDRTREYPITTAQGLPNGKHRLEIIAESPELPLIDSIRIFRPQ